MISSETPYKLAEIIQDMWPNLYRPPSDFKPPSLYRPIKKKYNKEKDHESPKEL
jgi:hypothetical protein